MKKAILVLNAICWAVFVPASFAQTASTSLAGPPRDGTSHDTPSMNDQIGDARGSEADRAAAQQTPVKPSRQSAREEKLSGSPVIPTDPLSRREPVPTDVNPTQAMDSTSFGKQLSAMRYNAREEMLTELDRRMKANESEIEQLKASSVHFTGAARDRFSSAYGDWKAQQKHLRQEEEAVRNASPESWEPARTALGNSFEAYVVTMTRTEAASSLQP